jgi:HAD superfamily hydrolase (TIGR01490 family)
MIAGLQPKSQIAAFFDLDGTLVMGPSLERRYFRMLRQRRAIPIQNYFLWLAHAAQLAPAGIGPILHANKMYLRGVRADYGVLSLAGARRTRRPDLHSRQEHVPPFFPQAVDRVAWHAAQEHSVVLVTGTLAPLAEEMALALLLRLALRGLTASITVCATRLDRADGRWTGRIVGDALFGEAKARAMWHLAARAGFDLKRCYAYGDTAKDRWMLGAVGRPAVVNPSGELARIARLLDWPMLWWGKNAEEPGDQPTYTTVAGAKTESLR